MGLKQRVEEEIERLNPRLVELSQGEVTIISIDEENATVTLRVFRGILIANGINACCLWAEQLLKEAIPEIREVITVWGPLPDNTSG
ncbi:MAG: hypothetical protein H6Q52_2772 [Deltaproteobacteria bacterium]|nr:hypothetical protein [Deltaproteobacteria bacterium]